MIKNQKQLAAAKKEIIDLKQLLAEMNLDPIVQQADLKQRVQVSVLQGQMDDLSREVEEYEYLTSTDLEKLEIKTADLQKAIISFRIASGLTQKEIAEKLEIQEQQIQRYEQNDYLTASFERIIQILLSMKVDVTFKKEFSRKSKIKFLIPESKRSSLEYTIQKVSERKQLINW